MIVNVAQANRRGVTSVLGTLIILVMVFTVGVGLFIEISNSSGSLDQAGATRQASVQGASQEGLAVSPTLTPATGALGLAVINTGSTPSTIVAVFLTSSSGNLIQSTSGDSKSYLSSPPDLNITLPLTLSVGQSTSDLLGCAPGCDIGIGTAAFTYNAVTMGTILVSVLTEQGNVFSSQYPVTSSATTTISTNVVHSNTASTTATATTVTVVSSTVTSTTITSSCVDCVTTTAVAQGTTSLVITMQACPMTLAGGCSTASSAYNGQDILLTGTVQDVSAHQATGVSLNISPPTGETTGTAYLDVDSACSLTSTTIYSGGSVSFICSFTAYTGSSGGTVTFVGNAQGSVLGSVSTSAETTSNTVVIGSQGNTGPFLINYFFYRYASVSTKGAWASASFIYSGNTYVAYQLQVTNNFNSSLTILDQSFIENERLGGDSTFFIVQDVSYSGTPAITAYNCPTGASCVNPIAVSPGASATLDLAACPPASSSSSGSTVWGWQSAGGGSGSGCNGAGNPGWTPTEGDTVALVVFYSYKGNVYSQTLPFESEIISNSNPATPSLLLTPDSGPIGTLVTLSGTGYVASTQYSYCFSASATTACPSGTLTRFTTTAAGAIPAGVTIIVPTTNNEYVDVNQGIVGTNFIISAAFTTPTLTLTPSSGPSGTIVTLSGGNYIPSTVYTYCFSSSSTTACASGSSFTSTAAGYIPAGTTITVPTTKNTYVDVSQGANFVIAAPFNPTPSLALSPTLGLAGVSVTVSGFAFSANTPIGSITFGGVTPGTQTCTSATTDSTGAFTCTFAVPAGATVGSHAVLVSGSDLGSVPGDQASANFIVTSPTLTLIPAQGPVDTLVTIQGTGFSASTAMGAMTYGGVTPATQNCIGQTTSTTGSFSCAFTVPSGSTGAHTVIVSGSDIGTIAGDTASATFTLTTETLTLTPTTGPVGTSVTLSGTGYGYSTLYSYCFSASATTACPGGTLTTFTTTAAGAIPAGVTITVPASGNAYVDVSQGTVGTNFIISAPFTVTTPTLTLTPNTGPKGTLVTLSGSGYAPSTVYTFCFQSTAVSCASGSTFTSTAGGAIPAGVTITVPASGNAYVDVSQGTAAANFIISAPFTVTTATLTLTPASGPVGTLITLSGSGYAPSTVYTFCFQSTAVSCASGATFTSTAAGAIPSTPVTITVPASGNAYVDVSQGTAAANFIISATFTVKTPVLAITPSSGPVGTLVTLSLSSGVLAPSTTYTYCAQTTATTCASGSTFTSDATGAIPAGITLTISSAASNKVDLSSNTFYISATFTVTTPVLAITPASGPVGTLVTLSLSSGALAPSTTYTYCAQTTATTCASGSTFTSTAGGAIPTGVTLTISSATSNKVDLSFSTTFFISATYTVTTPTLTLTPAQGPVGTVVTLSGTGYAPSTLYAYCFQATAVACPSGTATIFTSTAGGAIPAGVTITVPASGNAYVDVSQGTVGTNFITSAELYGNHSDAHPDTDLRTTDHKDHALRLRIRLLHAVQRLPQHEFDHGHLRLRFHQQLHLQRHGSHPRCLDGDRAGGHGRRVRLRHRLLRIDDILVGGLCGHDPDHRALANSGPCRHFCHGHRERVLRQHDHRHLHLQRRDASRPDLHLADDFHDRHVHLQLHGARRHNCREPRRSRIGQ